MTDTTNNATETQTFMLWFRPPKRPGTARRWEPLGTYASEREAWQAAYISTRGSGDYQILPQGQEP